MKDSPAEKAGFKVDDVVIAVNDNMSQNLQLYKSMLQNTGDKVKILVNRRPDRHAGVEHESKKYLINSFISGY